MRNSKTVDGFATDWHGMAAPFLTADLPGIGGVIKKEPEDFVVEEIPAYELLGCGEHLFLWVEKRATSAEALTRHIARVLGLRTHDVGVAGLKDRQAVTRQFVSVPMRCAGNVGDLNTDSIRVLHSARHRNKLRTGHLKGNRFTVLVRGVADEALQIARPIADRISVMGFPNYYGEQRFGVGGETLQSGFDLLHGRKTPAQLPRSRRKFLLRLSLSAVQSWLFNQALAERLTEDMAHKVLEGDVLQVVASGGKFVAEDATVEQQRADCAETVITGPMFGPKMTQPSGEPAAREAHLLAAHQLTLRDFTQFKKLTSGTRRPYLVRPEELSIASEPEGLRFRFTLPSGAYATVLLREFQKPPAHL